MNQPALQTIRDELEFLDDVFKAVLPTVVAAMPATSTNVEVQMVRAVEAAFDIAEKAVAARRSRHSAAYGQPARRTA